MTRTTDAPSTGGIRIPALDAIRAVASLMVLLTHVGFQTGVSLHGTVGGLLARMDLGVAIFFVLSGLLLVIPWAEQGVHLRAAPSTRVYLWHRFLRIMPAYWIAVAAAFLLLPANAGASRSTVVANLTLTQIYQPGQLVTGLTQMWSLCTEAAFYLALPVIGWALVRLLRRGGTGAALGGCLVLGVAGLGWVCFVQSTSVLDRSIAALWLPGYLPWFAAGLALGVLVITFRVGPEDRGARHFTAAANAPWTVWAIAAGLLLIASTSVAGPRGLTGFSSTSQAVTKSVLYAAIAVLVVLPATFGSGTTVHRVLVSRPMALLGRISYGIFLWHVVILDIVFRSLDLQPFTGHFWTILVVSLAASLVVAWLSWVLVERPVQRLRSRGPGHQRQGKPDQAGRLRPEQVTGISVS